MRRSIRSRSGNIRSRSSCRLDDVDMQPSVGAKRPSLCHYTKEKAIERSVTIIGV